ncbi:hypothetical protein C366_02599 [Cryptococcus neoformans Tu401-1]|nr:hypothetical protein C365_02743 [Cryptococcus neoformans var. grubii Bt85]OXG19741.1 hypothetical protein C366_02599 [Cryptococcus neoformans var. grubii Tu401-1]OXM79857.1 hypothetical protein C364_02563 [Cryptococcus neoformans var. grubii Bt63]
MSIEEKGGIQLMEQAHLRAETWSISDFVGQDVMQWGGILVDVGLGPASVK